MYDQSISPLLERCTNEELDPLVKFLTSPLTSSLRHHSLYRANEPDHRQYIELIVKEIRLNAGHSIAHRLKSGPDGKDYYEALSDALIELGTRKEHIPDALIEREQLIVQKCIDTRFSKRDKDEQKQLLEEFYRGEWYDEKEIKKRRFYDDYLLHEPGKSWRKLRPGHVAATAKAKTQTYIKDKIKGKLVKTGIKFLFKRASGPIAIGLGLWDMLGPEWNMFIPVVCYISYLRNLKGMDTPETSIISN